MLFTFLRTLILHSTKRVHERVHWCSSSIACQEKRTDWILRIFTFTDTNPSYLPIISALQFFEGQGNQGVTQLVIKPFGISKTSRIVSLRLKKNARFFQTPLLLLIYFLDNTSHKFWDQSCSPYYQCCLPVWDSFLAQASALLLCQYLTT